MWLWFNFLLGLGCRCLLRPWWPLRDRLWLRYGRAAAAFELNGTTRPATSFSAGLDFVLHFLVIDSRNRSQLQPLHIGLGRERNLVVGTFCAPRLGIQLVGGFAVSVQFGNVPHVIQCEAILGIELVGLFKVAAGALGVVTIEGRDAAKEVLKNDKALYAEIETAVKAKLDEDKH